MLRTLTNLMLALVLVVTLVWGGCVSCSQYFMFASSHSSCCNPSGHCGKVPTPAAKDCHIQPMALAKATVVAAPTITAAVLPVTIAMVHLPRNVRPVELLPADADPPDLCLRNSILRI